MSDIFKVLLSLSLSGSVLILAVMLICKLLKNRFSNHWRYYIWLVVVLRLLIPFSLDIDISGIFSGEQGPVVSSDVGGAAATQYNDGLVTVAADPTDNMGVADHRPSSPGNVVNNLSILTDCLWIPWLLVALILLIRKITLYQSFAKYIKAGKTEVSDPAILNLFGNICEQAGIKRHIELYTNSLVSSPLLMGIFKPCIVLPSMPGGEMEFRYICSHELIHYRKGDIFYKWLVQITLCFHWFNPLVHLMARDINRACELSCDEVLIHGLTPEEREIYGDTLLESLKTPGEYREGIAALTLSENASRLKERLDAIKGFHKSRKGIIALSIVLSVCLFFGGFALGVYYPAEAIIKSEPNGGELSDEGLPIMSASNRNVYETYIKNITVVGLLRKNFSPEDTYALLENGGMSLLTMVQALEREEFEKNNYYEYIPARFADMVLTTYLPLRQDKIREVCADLYNAETDAYEYFGGLGGGPAIPIVTQYEQSGDLLTIQYTWYVGDPSADEFQYKSSDSGELIIKHSGDVFCYLSNKVIPYEQNISNDEYLLTIIDVNKNDISNEIIRLWKNSNDIYNVDDTRMFEMGDSIQLFDDAPEFYEIINYDQEVDAVFTSNGKTQLEQTKIGGPYTLIQKQDGRVYRMGPWRTGYSYADALEGIKVKQVLDDKLVLEVKFRKPVKVDDLPTYDYVNFAVRKINDIWLVEDYIYPEANNEPVVSNELNALKPEILPILQALIAAYENNYENTVRGVDYGEIPEYCYLPAVESISNFSLRQSEMGLVATIPITGAGEWQMDVLLSNLHGVYVASGAEFNIVPGSFMDKAMARGLSFSQVRSLIAGSFSEDEILTLPIAELQRVFSQFLETTNTDDKGFVTLGYTELKNMADSGSEFIYPGESFMGWSVVRAETIGIPYGVYVMEAESLTAVMMGEMQVTGSFRRDQNALVFIVADESAPLMPTSTISPSREIVITNADDARVARTLELLVDGRQVKIMISEYAIFYTAILDFDANGDPSVSNPQLIQQADFVSLS